MPRPRCSCPLQEQLPLWSRGSRDRAWGSPRGLQFDFSSSAVISPSSACGHWAGWLDVEMMSADMVHFAFFCWLACFAPPCCCVGAVNAILRLRDAKSRDVKILNVGEGLGRAAWAVGAVRWETPHGWLYAMSKLLATLTTAGCPATLVRDCGRGDFVAGFCLFVCPRTHIKLGRFSHIWSLCLDVLGLFKVGLKL